MKVFAYLFVFLFVPLAALAAANPDEAVNGIRALDWHIGPQSESVAGKATLKTDEALAFLDDKNTSKFLELTGNLSQSGHFLLLSPKEEWWAVFSFDPIGYVKDDEKIDPDALLKQLKDSDGPANEERKRLGLTPVYTDGWYVPPHYDPESKRLEWGLKLISEGKEGLNYTIRLLGRTGVVNATLVSDPASLDADVKAFKAALGGFEFNGGERYAEYREGDRVAEIGLAALIAGGAAALATKKGLWAVIGGFLAAGWKFVAAAFVGLAAWIGSRFKKKA